MEKKRFLIGFIKYSGWLEIIFGLMLIFVMNDLMIQLGLQNMAFWMQFGGISLLYMGIILYISGRNLEKYSIIPIISSIFRFTMVIAEIVCIIYYLSVNPMFAYIISGATVYDFGSAVFTLILMKQNGYLLNKT
jgi:hypothetical protein